MLLKEILQRVQSLYSKGVQSDDTRLKPRHTYNKLLTGRSKLLSQQAKKKQKISDWNYVILPCVELIKVSSHDCPCLPQIGCKVYRTKYPLPRPMTNLNVHLIDWVLTLGGDRKFNEKTRDGQRNLKGNKYTKATDTFVLENSHAYFYGKDLPKVVKIKLLAEDPIKALDYPSICDGEDCEDCTDCVSAFDKEFPIDADLIDTLVELTYGELVDGFSKMQQDLTNDTRGKTRGPQK